MQNHYFLRSCNNKMENNNDQKITSITKKPKRIKSNNINNNNIVNNNNNNNNHNRHRSLSPKQTQIIDEILTSFTAINRNNKYNSNNRYTCCCLKLSGIGWPLILTALTGFEAVVIMFVHNNIQALPELHCYQDYSNNSNITLYKACLELAYEIQPYQNKISNYSLQLYYAELVSNIIILIFTSFFGSFINDIVHVQNAFMAGGEFVIFLLLILVGTGINAFYYKSSMLLNLLMIIYSYIIGYFGNGKEYFNSFVDSSIAKRFGCCQKVNPIDQNDNDEKTEDEQETKLETTNTEIVPSNSIMFHLL